MDARLRSAWHFVVVALLAGVILAAAGAAFGGWVGWRDAKPLPATDEVIAIAHTAVTGQTPTKTARRDERFGYVLPDDTATAKWLTRILGADDYHPGAVTVTYDEIRDPKPALVNVVERLRADGWTAGYVSHSSEGPQAHGTRGDTAVIVRTTALADEHGHLTGTWRIDVVVTRTEPAAVASAELVGGAAGFAIGVLLAAAGWYLARRRNPVSFGFAVTGLTLLAGPSLLSIGFIVLSHDTLPFGIATEAPWSLYMVPVVRAPLYIGACALLAALVLRLKSATVARTGARATEGSS